MTENTATFKKNERLCAQKTIDLLFKGSHSKSAVAFPLRAVFMLTNELETTQMLVSIPKRHFKRAVKRNRLKRLVREAYRHNKHILPETGLAIAFVWLEGEMRNHDQVETKMVNLLHRIAETYPKLVEQMMETDETTVNNDAVDSIDIHVEE